MQNKLTNLSEVNEENSVEIPYDDARVIKEVLCQDLQDHCGSDKATFDPINMIKFSD